MIGLIAQRAGCTRETVRVKCQEFERLQQAIDDEKNSSVDIIESKLIKKAKSGSYPHIRLYLTAKGRDRGYGEIRELSGSVKIILTPEEGSW